MFSCSKSKVQQLDVNSPDDRINITFDISCSTPSYEVTFKGEPVIKNSALGLVFKNMEALDSNLIIIDYSTSGVDETWEQPWGEQRLVHDNHNQLLVHLQEKSGLKRKIDVEFKAFNDGIGFRYIFPEQGYDSFIIMDELTEFAFTNNHLAWFIPANTVKKYELLYEQKPLNELDITQTPLTIEIKNDFYVSIHEAALVDYSSMLLQAKSENTLKAELVPWADGSKVKTNGSFKTPWRTITIGETPGDLVESTFILNLNEPNKLGDVSWVKPMKYIGIWWGIHIAKWSFNQSPILGATTENTKQYIDFAAKHGFEEVLVEGWNEGFEGTWHADYGPNQDFTTPNPSFDWFNLQEYALSKGVTIQAYNETCANSINYLNQIDSAFAIYEKLGYKSVKVGQVMGGTRKFINGEYCDGQYGVNYYQTVINKAVKHKLSINFHEPIKATGLRRTYPNLVSREGARGQEYNAWDWKGGNPPEHLTILPFTRMLSGPMDFTPGIFRVDIPQKPENRVNTTLAKQLAIYVVIYSPIQMAADLIENYEDHPAFQFIKDVPVNWETTKVLDAAIGDYIITARNDVDSEDWYLGAMTDEEAREFEIKLDFLDGGEYEAQIYTDSEKTDLETAPMEYEIFKQKVTALDTLKLKLANSGGAAIRFKKIVIQ